MSIVPTDPQLEERMAGCIAAYNAGLPSFFDFFAEDATVFSLGSVEPYTSREAYREAFAPKLQQERRAMELISRNVQLTNDRAIVAQAGQVELEGVLVNIRQTAVWVKRDGWQIQHLHNALVGSPAPRATDKSPSAIRVLNERIATIAAVVGVAQ